MRRLLFLTLAVSLSGCMVGPDYRRPTVEIPPSYRYESKDAQTTVNTVWWKQFGDPVLDDLIAQALANNALTGALTKLMALSEAYPQLKANENFNHLQNALNETESCWSPV